MDITFLFPLDKYTDMELLALYTVWFYNKLTGSFQSNCRSTMHEGSSCSISSLVFDDGLFCHSSWCIMLLYLANYLHFPADCWYWASFCVHICHSYIFYEMFLQIFVTIKKMVFSSWKISSYILDTNLLSNIWMFPPSFWLAVLLS